MPYEAQLRFDDEATKIPQKKISQYLKNTGINYVDAYDRFKNNKIGTKNLFLPEDPMHLSPKGHEIIYEIILATLS